MYCPVVIMSPDFSFEIKQKQRSNGAYVSPTILYLKKSVYIFGKNMGTMS